ncbi:unnamed protein product [Calypogeia fissa]
MVSRKLQNVTIPSYFMCPISLDLMRDPVTLSTGMTYDRCSIEKWLDEGNLTCPATMQVLENTQLTPNHTLRRLIQEWCVLNRSKGVERIPTPKLPAQPEEVKAMLQEVKSTSCSVNRTFSIVKRLRNLARESEKNRKCIADAGALQVLVAILCTDGIQLEDWQDGGYGSSIADIISASNKLWMELTEEILATVVLIASVDFMDRLVAGPQQLACICWFLKRGSIESKVNAALVLEGLTKNTDLKNTVAEVDGVMEPLVGMLKEQFYPKAVKASLKCLLALCAVRKNRIKAVELGAVSALVEILPSTETRGMLERALKILELLSSCAEGREAISEHALAIPMLVKLMLRASESTTEHAVVILWMACMYATNCSEVRDSAVQAGAFTRLLLLLQTDCSHRTKQKAVELLKLLRDVWSQHPCSPGKKALSRITPF